MKNIEIYKKVADSIPYFLKDKDEDLSFDDIFFGFYFIDDIDKKELIKKFNIKSNNEKKLNDLLDFIKVLITQTDYELSKTKLIINKNNLIQNNNIKEIEDYLAEEFYLKKIFIEKITFYFNSINIKIDFKLEDLKGYETKIFSLRFYENYTLYDNNRNMIKDMFIKKLYVDFLEIKKCPKEIINKLKNSKLIDLKDNIKIANLVNY